MIKGWEQPHCLWEGLTQGGKSDSEVPGYFCPAVRFKVKAPRGRAVAIVSALVMAGPGMGPGGGILAGSQEADGSVWQAACRVPDPVGEASTVPLP